MKEIFSTNGDIKKNAYLNWLPQKHRYAQNFICMAEGYISSAISLIQLCLDDNKDHIADTYIYPIIFLINQAIELYEKSILLSLNILLNKKERLITGHDIFEYWVLAKKLIKEYGFGVGCDKDDFEKMIQDLEKYLDELNNELENSPDRDKLFFTRYPTNRKSRNYYYIDSATNVVVDLECLLSITKSIKDCLNNLSWYYSGLSDEVLLIDEVNK